MHWSISESSQSGKFCLGSSTFYGELIFHSPIRHRFTNTYSQTRVSANQAYVSQQIQSTGGSASQLTRSSPNAQTRLLDCLYFYQSSRDFCDAAREEPPVFNVESTVLIAACEMILVLDLLATLVLFVVSFLFEHFSPSSATSCESLLLSFFLLTTTTIT
jgi:hypothetical protein